MNDVAKNLKLSLTCSYCSKILKCPIKLPCKDLICQEHLQEQEVVKQNKIKCLNCNQEFQVKDSEFRSAKSIQKKINSKDYLSGEELTLKQKIEESIKVLYQKYEEFNSTFTKIDLDCREHFEEIRSQLDQCRKQLKEKIDEIYTEMIYKTREVESSYLKNLNLNNETFIKSLEFKSVEDDLKDLEETFRNPNILIESIKEMQQKQEENIKILKFKFIEMNQIKNYLKATNEFKPDLNFNIDLFGQLNLTEYSSDPFKSKILTGQQSSALLKLCEFNSRDRFKLLYRASEHGFGSKDFHSNCDFIPNTLTILKARESSFIFGGFASSTWDYELNDFKSDPNAFLFSLTNKDNKPCKIKIGQNEHQYSIYCSSDHGPKFGGHDICITSHSNTNKDSYSELGFTYTHPQYACGTDEAKSFLAGSYKFQLSEIEVYQKKF